MPDVKHAHRLLFALALAAGLAPAVRASDAHAEPARAAPRAEPPAASAAASAPVRKARGTVAPDPMDHLRERLAEKLGATKPPEGNPNVMRVASRAPATPAVPTHEPKAAIAGDPHGPIAVARAAARPRPASAKSEGGHGAHAGAAHWDYQGENGPARWGEMKPEFAACSTGTRQSPIDIRDGFKLQLDPVQFDYRPGSFRVIDNGHTVQVNVAAGSSIEVMGRRFELVQFHFHRPSEERIDGRQFDMVAHLVHKDLDGQLAVVAVLLERGSALPLVQTVWNNLPLEKNIEVPARAPIDLTTLLPADRSYFTYMGSLTTPPCSEGVLWMVLKQPVAISPEQLSIFARLYPMNARPIQSASGRVIKESN
jgi:carbonic anhydrase